MRESPELTRHAHRSSRRRLVAFVAASSVCIAATALMTALVITRTAVAPAVAVIAVPMPYPMALPAPAPAIETPEPAAPPRATSPRIDAACVLPHPLGVEDPACGWDDGLPAISADGTLIASSYNPDDGGNRGNPGLIVRFVDTRTSRTVREVVVLSPDEVEPEAEQHPLALRARIARRAADAQRTLDAGRYRSLRLLADGEGFPHADDIGDDATVVGDLRTEITGDAIRISDVTTSTALVQARFPASEAFPPRSDDADLDDCRPVMVRGIDVWWDDGTRNAYAEVTYTSPPCYCGDELRSYVRRATDRARG